MNRVDVLKEMTEVRKDLDAFKTAYDAVNGRKRERADQGNEDLLNFADWPGTIATMNVLIMCITRCEGILEDLERNLERLPHGLAPVENNHEHKSE